MRGIFVSLIALVLSIQAAMCSDLSSSIPLDWTTQVEQGSMLFTTAEPNQYLMATGMDFSRIDLIISLTDPLFF
jgi:hypothetical protein